jgi:predicted helicase
LVPKDQTNSSEFYGLTSVRDLFPTNSVGLATANDELTIHFSRSELEHLIDQLLKLDFNQVDTQRNGKLNPLEWRVVFEIETGKLALRNSKEADDWRLRWAVDDIRNSGDYKRHLATIRYRPFDDRWTFYSGNSGGFICRPRSEVLRHLLDGNNIAFSTSRMTKGEVFGHILACDKPSEVIGLSSKTSNNAYSFPLWLLPTEGEKARRPNIDRSLASTLGQAISLVYHDGIPRGEQQSFGDDYRKTKPQQVSLLDNAWDGRGDLAKTFGPRDLFDYIYAVLHAPSYRNRYAEFLKSDFPRVPTPGSRELFQKLVKLGTELVALHLLKPEEAPVLKKPDVTFHGQGEARVAKGFPKFDKGKVSINASRWFEDVPEATWNFHVGGYQVLDKWLSDRSATGGKKPKPGRVLTDDDILHYRRIVVALTETRRIMAEIDKVIEAHGGWPSAFGSDVAPVT